MNDRHRYRAFFDGKMYYDIQFDQHYYDLLDDKASFSWWLDDDWKYEQPTIMQCTGLKDKNGKLIYEGDILQNEEGAIFSKTHRANVIWGGTDEAACFIWNPWVGDIILNSDVIQYLEIIGNIYENPDLIMENVPQ